MINQIITIRPCSTPGWYEGIPWKSEPEEFFSKMAFACAQTLEVDARSQWGELDGRRIVHAMLDKNEAWSVQN